MTPQAPTNPSLLPQARFNPWPASIIATFAVFISGTIALVVIATRDRSDLVAADYYEQEIRFQSRLDQLQRTAPLAHQILAQHLPTPDHIEIAIPRSHAAAGATGDIRLYRPNLATADRSLPLATSPDGRQIIPAADLADGLWKVQIQWKAGADEFFADRPVVVRRETPAPR